MATPAQALRNERRVLVQRSRTSFLAVQKHLIWYAFIFPAVALILLFIAAPLVQSLRLGFYEWNGLRRPEFIGVENFVSVFEDRFFWNALRNTLLFALSATTGTVGIGLLLAVAISRQVWGARVYRFIFYLPVMMPMAVTALLWSRLYEPNFGVLNRLLTALGLDNMAMVWLGDPRLALFAIILVIVWQFTGFPMIVLLAAIEEIPIDIHEAASLDGVNEWQRLRFIILPLIRPVLFSISLLQIIGTLKMFDIIWVMTEGGPAESSSVLGTYLYRQAFLEHDFGYASAVAVIMFLIIFGLTYAYQRLTRIEQIEA